MTLSRSAKGVLVEPAFLLRIQIFHVHLVLVFEVIVDAVPGMKTDVKIVAEAETGARTPNETAEVRGTEAETCKTSEAEEEA